MRRASLSFTLTVVSCIALVGAAGPALADDARHFHGQDCGHSQDGDAWVDFPPGHEHDADCGHFYYAGAWNLFPEGHEHGADCGHFYANGRWDYFPSKHRHGDACGHSYHGGVWNIFPRGHLHAPGCGHFYWAGCWQTLPQGHEHGADCGHIFAFGDWRPLTPGERARLASAATAAERADDPRGVWARPYDGRIGEEEAAGPRRFPRPAAETLPAIAREEDPQAPVIAGGGVPLTVIDVRRPSAGRVTAVAPAPAGQSAAATAEALRAVGFGAGDDGFVEAQAPPALEPEVIYLEPEVAYYDQSRVTAYPRGVYEPDAIVGRVVVAHVHGAGCGHLYTQGAWRPTGLPPERGYDGFPRGPIACFAVPDPPPPHVHGSGCGHIFTSGRWQAPPAGTYSYSSGYGHVHGAGCSASGCAVSLGSTTHRVTSYTLSSGGSYSYGYGYSTPYGSYGNGCRPETGYRSSIQHRAGCRCASCCPPRTVRFPSRTDRRYR